MDWGNCLFVDEDIGDPRTNFHKGDISVEVGSGERKE
jgi:hypothetical protein